MKPVLDTIKSDKVVDNNFQQIQSVLGGNVGLDNMPVRILEGITGAADSKKFVNHSGNSRPVGWLPLVGDVYVQEISDKYLDVRSTKPEVAFKILIIFGQAITDSSLKVVGGDGYQDTNDVTINKVTQEIEAIEETVLQFKPLAIRSYILPNPRTPAALLSYGYNKVLADKNYFYILTAGPTEKILYRIDRETTDVTYLDFTAILGSGLLGTMTWYDSDIYIITRFGAEKVLRVDTVTFTLTGSWSRGVDSWGIGDIYVDYDYIYYIAWRNISVPRADIIRLDRYTGVFNGIEKFVGTSGTGGSIMYVPGDITASPVINGALFIVVQASSSIRGVWRVEIEDIATGSPMFLFTNNILCPNDTEGNNFTHKVGIYTNGVLLIPQQGKVNTYGSFPYSSGVTVMETIPPNFTRTFLPIANPSCYTWNTNTLVANGGYIYQVTGYSASPLGVRINRGDPVTNEVVSFFIPLAISGEGNIGINSFICTDYDGELLFIRNTSSTDGSSFEFATVDFTDYDLTTP